MRSSSIQTSVVIDDSGWGYLVGGIVVVGLVLPESRVVTRVVPLKFFQRDNYWKNGCRDAITAAAWSIARSIPDTPRVLLCRGFLFDDVAVKLKKAGYKVRRVEVSGRAQRESEKAFARYLGRLCKYPFAYPDAQPRKPCLGSLSKAKSWLVEDLTRTRYVKTGWGAWPRIHHELRNARAIVDVANVVGGEAC